MRHAFYRRLISSDVRGVLQLFSVAHVRMVPSKP